MNNDEKELMSQRMPLKRKDSTADTDKACAQEKAKRSRKDMHLRMICLRVMRNLDKTMVLLSPSYRRLC
jgi:hypothetical protein